MLTNDPEWVIEQEGFEASREREMEALFSIGNGQLSVRGAMDLPIPTEQGDLFIAGVFDQKKLCPGCPGVVLVSQNDTPDSEIVPFPFPFRLQVEVNGDPLTPTESGLVFHNRLLDLKKGSLFENYVFEDKEGRRTSIHTTRRACMHLPHLLLHSIEVTPQNYSGTIRIDTSSEANDLPLNHPHLSLVESKQHSFPCETFTYRTQKSGVITSISSRMFLNGHESDTTSATLPVAQGESVFVQRFVRVTTSQDLTDFTPQQFLALKFADFDAIVLEHEAVWRRFWEHNDIRFIGGTETSSPTRQANRFNLYHLRIAADHDPRMSVGARALTGRSYDGHIFWDTEVFLFPFYLYTEPEIAKTILLYRYNTLQKARDRAAITGMQGACYPWESSLTGTDVTPDKLLLPGSKHEIPIFNGKRQLHVTADIAYALWRYWDATLDDAFISDFGLEILVETARFWMSRATPIEGAFHILHVIGPDEYHVDVDDNYYTNWLVARNLQNAAFFSFRTRMLFPDKWLELKHRLNIRPDEPSNWAAAAQAMYLPRPNDQGVIEQFKGFFDLQDVLVIQKHRPQAPVHHFIDWEEINRQKIIKQADVLMIPFLEPDSFPLSILRACYHYYEPITAHGSSLSPSVHAALASRLGLHNQAHAFWEQALFLDLEDLMKNSALGIHIASMGGTWQALVFHMLGTRFKDGSLFLTPGWENRLPNGYSGVRMKLYYRGKRYQITTPVTAVRRAAA